MISALYIEKAIRDHPRAQCLQERFPQVPHIVCQRYGEVFNRRGQDFRLQKRRPALILAEKREGHVLPTPPGYGVGSPANYYFSHILNCLYDCRYCFLQGLYRSANYVFFLNFEDFQQKIDSLLEHHQDKVTFFSGYDGDSFALESLTEFVQTHLDFFACRPRAQLELRTKSLKAADLLRRSPLENVIVAFSLTPAPISQAYEKGVPPLHRRLDLLGRLAQRGWPIGLRFDPVICHQGQQPHYEELFNQVFQRLAPSQVHSVSLGGMRFPRGLHRQMTRLYPEEPLLASPQGNAGPDTPAAVEEHALLDELTEALQRRGVPQERVFRCAG